MTVRQLSTVAAVASLTSSAWARQASYVTQLRTITAETNGSGVVSAMAPDFGPWAGVADAYFVYVPPGQLMAHVTQDSTLAPDRITVQGQFVLTPPAFHGTGFASGTGHLETQFRVSRATLFQLSGTIEPNSPISPLIQPRTARLSGPGVSISLENPGTFSLNGILQPDSTYALLVDVGSYALLNSSTNAIAGFDTTLLMSTCYANCDGSTTAPDLNVNDFVCFLNRFAAGDSYANCDASTTPPALNVLDFTCFLNAFAAGCP